MKITHHRTGLLTAILFLVVPIATVNGDPLVGDLSLLTRVADSVAQNFHDLNSWSGTAEVSTSSSSGLPEPTCQALAKISFVCDLHRDCSKWVYTLNSEIIGKDKTTPIISSGMLCKDSVYRVAPYPADESRPSNLTLLVVARPMGPAEPMQSWNDDFRPTAYFVDPGPEGGTPQLLRWYKEHAKDPDLLGGVIKEEGDLIVLEIKSGENINRYEFSKMSGYNITKRYMASHDVERTEIIAYNSYQGVYVPSIFTSVQSNKNGDGNTVTTRNETKLVNCQVNTANTQDEFTIEQLGLRDGDVVSDKVRGLTYNYKPSSGAGYSTSKMSIGLMLGSVLKQQPKISCNCLASFHA